MKIEIREVRKEDLEDVTKLEGICFPKEEAATKESFEYRIKTFPTSFYVALIDNKIVGLIDGCMTDFEIIVDELYDPEGGHNPNGKNQSIFGLAVDPDFQRRGIAEKLMNYLIEKSKERCKEKMILTCKDRLIHYYEKFGYVNKGVSASVHGGVVWYDMVKEL